MTHENIHTEIANFMQKKGYIVHDFMEDNEDYFSSSFSGQKFSMIVETSNDEESEIQLTVYDVSGEETICYDEQSFNPDAVAEFIEYMECYYPEQQPEYNGPISVDQVIKF